MILLKALVLAATLSGLAHAQVSGSLEMQAGTILQSDFDLLGYSRFVDIDRALAPHGGFNAAYERFLNEEKDSQLSAGLWSKAEAFSRHLKECGVEITAERLALKLGIQSIFETRNDSEVTNILQELGPKLSFEQKVEFISQLGGELLRGYDYQRSGGGPNSDGSVSFRQMIEAKQNGTKAGVCRDMSLAMAQALKQMGVTQTYVVGYQTMGGGHATLLIQDPNNKDKTYNINYNFVTSNESLDSASHLLQDSTIPSVGTNMRIYDADGKYVTSLPTHLGQMLRDMAGGRPQTALSENEGRLVTGSLNVGSKSSLSLSHGQTASGDNVTSVGANLNSGGENLPAKMSVVLYRNQRETSMKGDLESYGAYLLADFQPRTPAVSVSEGLSVRAVGEFTMNFNMSRSSMSGTSSAPAISADMHNSLGAGGEIKYESNDGSTRINASMVASGTFTNMVVSDSGSKGFDLRDYTFNASVEQRLSDIVTGYANSTVVVHGNQLGVHGNQEVGLQFRLPSSNSSARLIVGHQGPIDEGPAFMPGNVDRYYAEAGFSDKHRNTVSGGVFCNRLERLVCGLQVTGKVKFGPGN